MSREWNPLPYMERAMEFALQRAGSGLMLDPGMRKTSITLAVIDILRHVGEIRKTLVVAPLRVCQTVWRQEGMKWQNFNHLDIVDLSQRTREEQVRLMNEDHHVYLVNHAVLADKTVRNKVYPGILGLIPKDFDLFVADESTKFKDTQTLQFKALKKVLHNFKRRMILTGTPIPNGLADLFGQMYVVDFGESLGKYITHFRMEFQHQRPGDAYGWHLNRGAPELIYKRVDNKLMRLDIKDHIAMPDIVPNEIPVYLPEHLEDHYRELEKAFVTQMDDTAIAVFNPSAVGTKLRQMANGFIYDDGGGAYERRAIRLHNEKIDALEELVEEMQGRPLLVAYEFEEDGVMIAERFPDAVNLGKSKNIERDVLRFNAGDIPMAYAQGGSISHGLNLQEACNTICWYGITWNLEHYIQLNDRVYRSGQEAAAVVIHHIVCKGTKDEKVAATLIDKDRTQKAFNDAIRK